MLNQRLRRWLNISPIVFNVSGLQRWVKTILVVCSATFLAFKTPTNTYQHESLSNTGPSRLDTLLFWYYMLMSWALFLGQKSGKCT